MEQYVRGTREMKYRRNRAPETLGEPVTVSTVTQGRTVVHGDLKVEVRLIKYKKTVRGGDMVIVNQTVAPALERLGYSPTEVEAINEHIREQV